MPAKGSDDLFKLIKALSPVEKGYFKKFADRYSFSEKDNNYLKLFELIDAQEVYDEKKLQKNPVVNQLPRQKNYLQALILRSLQMFDSESTLTLEIENSIQQIRVLLRRGQYDLCRKLLIKTKKEAMRCEFFLEVLKLSHLENYLNKESGADKTYEQEKSAYREREILMKQEKNADDMLELEQQVILFTRNNYTKNAALKNKLLDEVPPLLSLKAKLTYYNTMAAYYNFTKNYDKQYVYSKEYLKFQKKGFKIFKRFYTLLPAYANYFFACLANKRYKECNDLAKEMLSGRLDNAHQEEFRQQLYLFLKTILFLATGKFEQGLVFVKESVESRQENKHLINHRMDAELTLNTVLIYFGNKQYKSCLKHIGKILSAETKEQAAYIYYQALSVNILIHYELGNNETTEHLIISARRTFKNNNMFKPLEDILFTFLKKYIANESKKSLLAEAVRDLKNIEVEENYHSYASIYSFCLSWLESKLKGKSFPDTVKEKARKQAGKNYWN